uniref:Uncharacterized protein n=1 Tax=Chlamydomonas euryale TaxID=1486919 RepID=A0A7R9V8V6_9CHLO
MWASGRRGDDAAGDAGVAVCGALSHTKVLTQLLDPRTLTCGPAAAAELLPAMTPPSPQQRQQQQPPKQQSPAQQRWQAPAAHAQPLRPKQQHQQLLTLQVKQSQVSQPQQPAPRAEVDLGLPKEHAPFWAAAATDESKGQLLLTSVNDLGLPRESALFWAAADEPRQLGGALARWAATAAVASVEYEEYVVASAVPPSRSAEAELRAWYQRACVAGAY